MMKSFLPSVLVVIATVVVICNQAMMVSSEAAPAPKCGAYKKASKPCMAYVKGTADDVPQKCCDGLKGYLADANTNKQKKIAACKCVTASANNPGYKAGRVQNVANACGFKLPPANTNCDSIP